LILKSTKKNKEKKIITIPEFHFSPTPTQEEKLQAFGPSLFLLIVASSSLPPFLFYLSAPPRLSTF